MSAPYTQILDFHVLIALGPSHVPDSEYEVENPQKLQQSSFWKACKPASLNRDWLSAHGWAGMDGRGRAWMWVLEHLRYSEVIFSLPKRHFAPRLGYWLDGGFYYHMLPKAQHPHLEWTVPLTSLPVRGSQLKRKLHILKL